jgi:hypothetical protein
MAFIGHVLPLVVLAAIIVLIVSNLSRRSLPRFTMPAPRPRPQPRPKRTTPLRLVKGAQMDRDLAELLRKEERPRPD